MKKNFLRKDVSWQNRGGIQETGSSGIQDMGLQQQRGKEGSHVTDWRAALLWSHLNRAGGQPPGCRDAGQNSYVQTMIERHSTELLDHLGQN